MSDTKTNNKIDVVCHCTETTRYTIKKLIENGVNQLDEISRMTGACSGCGSCEMAVLDLIAEYG